jgi:hypothetical protein
VKFFLALVIIVAFIIWLPIAFYIHMRNAKLIREGKAAYFVKVAPSGKGNVYHNPSCGRCRSNLLIRIDTAENEGYLPCSICGGRGMFRRLI